MSDGALELLRGTFAEAVARGGAGAELDALSPQALDVFFSALAAEAEFHEDPHFPEAGVYRGIEEVRRYLTGFGGPGDRSSQRRIAEARETYNGR